MQAPRDVLVAKLPLWQDPEALAAVTAWLSTAMVVLTVALALAVTAHWVLSNRISTIDRVASAEREIPVGRRSELLDVLRPFRGTFVTVTATGGHHHEEALSFAQAMHALLVDAGWEPGRGVAGGYPGYPEECLVEYHPKDEPVARALVTALRLLHYRVTPRAEEKYQGERRGDNPPVRLWIGFRR